MQLPALADWPLLRLHDLHIFSYLCSCLPWLTGRYSASVHEVRNLNRRLIINVGGERHEARGTENTLTNSIAIIEK